MRSWRQAIEVTLYDLHLSKKEPPIQKYNGAQKIAYTAIVLMGAGSLITGLSIYKPTQVHRHHQPPWRLRDGPVGAFFLTIGFMAFFLLHVFQVIKTGWNNFRGMVTGV